MRRIVGVLGILTAATAATEWWRRHRRVGTGFVNRVVDPWLVGHGLVDRARGELGILEHVGRRSGVTRRSPVRPVRMPTGYRIVVPLGGESQWARNVLAAGHCRLQIGSTIVELDEPAMVTPMEVRGVPRLLARAMTWLGVRYLTLHELVPFRDRDGDDSRPAVDPAEAIAV
jgi:deazaflavin-dependent oxidoreductase (nitroreductase family)